MKPNAARQATVAARIAAKAIHALGRDGTEAGIALAIDAALKPERDEFKTKTTALRATRGALVDLLNHETEERITSDPFLTQARAVVARTEGA